MTGRTAKFRMVYSGENIGQLTVVLWPGMPGWLHEDVAAGRTEQQQSWAEEKRKLERLEKQLAADRVREIQRNLKRNLESRIERLAELFRDHLETSRQHRTDFTDDHEVHFQTFLQSVVLTNQTAEDFRGFCVIVGDDYLRQMAFPVIEINLRGDHGVNLEKLVRNLIMDDMGFKLYAECRKLLMRLQALPSEENGDES